MLKIFLPALFLLSLIFFIRIIQYEPLYPEVATTTDAESNKKSTTIPIYPEDGLIGVKTASKTLIIFGDFGCENCKLEYELLRTLIKENPKKLKIVWKGLPVTTFPYSTELAQKYAFCATKQQKFEDFAEIAFNNSTTLDEQTLDEIINQIDIDTKNFKLCLSESEGSEAIQKTKNLAEALEIQSVPTIFFNNVQIKNPITIEEWQRVLSL